MASHQARSTKSTASEPLLNVCLHSPCSPQVADDSNGGELSIFDPRAQPWVQVGRVCACSLPPLLHEQHRVNQCKGMARKPRVQLLWSLLLSCSFEIRKDTLTSLSVLYCARLISVPLPPACSPRSGWMPRMATLQQLRCWPRQPWRKRLLHSAYAV